jgi:chaperone BCS1
MSTNYPEKLDSALIRPGRVDLQVEFTLATHDQIRDIFTRMYTVQGEEAKNRPVQSTEVKVAKVEVKKKGHTARKSVDDVLKLLGQGAAPSRVSTSPEKLAVMAVEFADQLLAGTFSPAEVQGYLLKKKTDPYGAGKESASWKDAVLEARKKGKKVVST